MANQVQICNMALAHCRAGAIERLNEESEESEKCKLFWTSALDFILTDNRWNFLQKEKKLALLNDKPIDWLFMYEYPSDAYKVFGVTPYIEKQKTQAGQIIRNGSCEGRYRWETMQGENDIVIVTDCPDATAIYSAKIKDITQLSQPLIDALVYYLAAKLAMPLVGGNEGRKIMNDSLNLYDNFIKSALKHDISQRNLVTIKEGTRHGRGYQA